MSAGNSRSFAAINPPRERLIVGLTLAGYILLALAFSLGPIFEGPDEVTRLLPLPPWPPAGL